MAGFLHLEKLDASINFNPPSKFLNPLESPIEQVAENLSAREDYCARTSIPTSLASSDKHTVTSLAQDHTIVANVIILAEALQTKFQDQPLEVDNSTESHAPAFLVPTTSVIF